VTSRSRAFVKSVRCMKKVDQIRFLLDQEIAPKEIAREVGCALSLVYGVRGRREMAQLKHQIAVLRQDLWDFGERLRLLEGGPESFAERMLARKASR
jgi:hypothetical protein